MIFWFSSNFTHNHYSTQDADDETCTLSSWLSFSDSTTTIDIDDYTIIWPSQSGALSVMNAECSEMD